MQTVVTYSPRTIADVIDGFLFYLQNVRRLSVYTVFHYGHDLSLFLRFLAHEQGKSTLDLTLEDVTPQHVQGFLRFLTTQRHNSERSAKRRLAALRSFFAYAYEPVTSAETSVAYYNPARSVSTPHANEPPPQALSGSDALRILRAARAHGANPVRDYAILRLFLHCGARLSEVLQLKLSDINLTDNWIRLGGGGKRDRIVPLSDETNHALAQYLSNRPCVAYDNVFISRNLHPITKGTIYHLVSKCLSNVALDCHVNLHTLRHTCYTMLAKEGFAAHEIQALAGLRRPQTPRIYVHMAAAEKSDQHS